MAFSPAKKFMHTPFNQWPLPPGALSAGPIEILEGKINANHLPVSEDHKTMGGFDRMTRIAFPVVFSIATNVPGLQVVFLDLIREAEHSDVCPRSIKIKEMAQDEKDKVQAVSRRLASSFQALELGGPRELAFVNFCLCMIHWAMGGQWGELVHGLSMFHQNIVFV